MGCGARLDAPGGSFFVESEWEMNRSIVANIFHLFPSATTHLIYTSISINAFRIPWAKIQPLGLSCIHICMSLFVFIYMKNRIYVTWRGSRHGTYDANILRSKSQRSLVISSTRTKNIYGRKYRCASHVLVAYSWFPRISFPLTLFSHSSSNIPSKNQEENRYWHFWSN